MKKIYKFLVPVVGIVLTFGLFAEIVTAAAPDQRCDASSNGFVSIIMPPEGMFSQTFRPTVNRLTRVKMRVYGDNVGTVGLLLYYGDTYLATNSNGMQAEPDGAGILTFEFDDVETRPYWAGHRIKPFYSAGNKVLAWYFLESCYEYGASYMGESEQTFDNDFATYGYNHEEPDPPADPPADGDTPADTDPPAETTETEDSASTGTTSDPGAKTTSLSIKAPSEVTAKDVANDQGGSVVVSWDESETSNIDGYQVYRKDSEEGDLEAIVAISSDGLTYTDESALVGTTYYYSVRTYKGDSESKDSDIVEAESLDNLAPSTPANFKIVSQNFSSIKLSWDVNIEEDLSGYVLSITQRDDSSDFAKIIEIGKGTTEYSLNKSDLGDIDFTEIDLYLQAKDVNSNYSDQTEVVKGEFKGLSTMYYWVGGVLLVILFAIVFIIYYKKKQRNNFQV